jgi:hypothetical protein
MPFDRDLTRSNEHKKPVRLILAPAGAGKSTFAALHTPEVVDGDMIVAKTVGWPVGEWWKDKAKAREVHLANEAAIRAYSELHDQPIIVFNGEWDATEKDVIAFVFPPVGKVIDQLTARDSLGLRAENSATSASVKTNIATLRSVRPSAPDFKTFEEAFAYVREKEA